MMQGTTIYEQQIEAFNTGQYNLFVHRGGARSSKTTSIIQFWLTWAFYQHELKRVPVMRKKATWCRATTLFDFIRVATEMGAMQECYYNDNKGILRYRNVEFWFGGLDDPQRIHGFTSDGVWINEANEAQKEDFDQLEMRCAGFMVLDYNPNVTDDHWIVHEEMRQGSKLITSTVIDNPFAPENVVKKIMSYEPTPENYARGTANKNKWDIYGRGIRAVIEGLIYPNITIVECIPNEIKKRFYGMDLGYSVDVTAILEVGMREESIWVDEHCYLTHQLSGDIIKTYKRLPAFKIWSESADPRLIDEIYNAGINIHPVKKPAGSVMAGINRLQELQIYVTERSINTIKEFRNYTYQQDKNGKYINEPIGEKNHSMDAIRYVVYMELLGKKLKGKQQLTSIFN